MKKWVVLLIIAALFCSFWGCSPAEDNTIWVVTETTSWDQMNGQIQAVIKAFSKAHSEVTVRLDILPTEEKERAAYLQQLRTQILQGGGPDAYLLPTDNQLFVDDGMSLKYVTVDPLFTDVMLAMENGMFQDVSSLYNTDSELGKDSLNAAIMDAGVLDGKRYVLPLRYDIPVIYAQTDVLTEAGFDLSALNKTLPELMQATLDTGNGYITAGGLFTGSAVFPDWIDYSDDQVLLQEAQLISYMALYRDLMCATLYGPAISMDVRSYAIGSYDSFQGIVGANINSMIRFPLYIGSLGKLLEYAPISQYEEGSYTILPLKESESGSIATVTYYAAVGSGCRNPELAYEFLRQFLLEESQWEENRPTKANIIVTSPGSPPRPTDQDKSNRTQRPGLIASGWPVRTDNSLAPLWEVRRTQFYNKNLSTSDRFRYRQIGLKPLEEDFAAILDAPVSQVRFPSVLDESFETMLHSLYEPTDTLWGYLPTDVSIPELAQQLIWDMRRHVAEG